MTTVHIAGKGPLGRLTRNRPVHADPGAALDTATAAPCRLRTGAGRAVSTGEDRSAATGPNPAFQAENRQIGYHPPIGPIATREQPAIAAVNGVAAAANIARQGIGCAPGAP